MRPVAKGQTGKKNSMNSHRQGKTCGVYFQKDAHTPDDQGLERILIWLDQEKRQSRGTWNFLGFEGNETQDNRDAEV